MNNKKYEKVCKNLDDTKQLAQKFAKLIEENGCFINLYGEIGAGKTAFVKLVAQGRIYKLFILPFSNHI